MLVSTIIPVYNRTAMLGRAVASVLAQTYRPIEIVIVDDGSTDDTPQFADALAAKHAEVRVLHERNGGPGAAREAGRQAARGELIQYLDSDDELLPRKFELQVAGLRAHPECGASYGWTRMHLRDGTIVAQPWKRTGETIATLFPAMLQSRWWETSTPLWRADLLAKAGPWTNLRMEEDWEHDCRVAALGVKLHHVADWIAEKHDHDDHQLTGKPQTPEILRDRARAHELILGHAQRAGIGPETKEMRHFARELFLLARQCGAAGLAAESSRLFQLAREASGGEHDRLQFRAYAALARTLGWRRAGRLSALVDRLRS